MSYLSRDIDKRINPEFLVPGAKSLIVTGLSYYTDKQQREPGVPILSRYAYGESYHDVITRKLDKLFAFIKTMKPEHEGRSFCRFSSASGKSLGSRGRSRLAGKTFNCDK